MELKNYPAPYVLFGSLLAMGNRLQAAGDRFYDEITTKQWFVLAVLENFSAPPTLGELARGVGSSHQDVYKRQVQENLAEPATTARRCSALW